MINTDVLDIPWCTNIVNMIPPHEKLNCGLSPYIHGVEKEFSSFNDNSAYIIDMTFAEDENMDSVLQPLTLYFLSYIGFDIEQELARNPMDIYIWNDINKKLEDLVDIKFPTKELLLYWIEKMRNMQSTITEDDVCPSILDVCEDKEPVSQEFLSMISCI